MKIVKIKSTERASKRTKERIKQHGPLFQVERVRGGPMETGWLLRQINSPENKEAWLGWLPWTEFNIIDVSA